MAYDSCYIPQIFLLIPSFNYNPSKPRTPRNTFQRKLINHASPLPIKITSHFLLVPRFIIFFRANRLSPRQDEINKQPSEKHPRRIQLASFITVHASFFRVPADPASRRARFTAIRYCRAEDSCPRSPSARALFTTGEKMTRVASVIRYPAPRG